MEKLNITLIQPDIIWEKPLENLAKYSKMLSTVQSTDVIVLPEMFTTGFSMAPEKLCENMNGPSVLWMKKRAREKNASVVGSLIINENENIYNRAVWVFPDGNIQFYDKRHLFSMGEEHLHYSPGNKKLIVEFRGWKFCPLVCYDLRFPVWSRNTEDYDVLLYVANWPAARHEVWKTLLHARAIENQAYCAGVNRIGKDGSGLNYLGASALILPKGKSEFLDDVEKSRTFSLSYSELHQFRKNFPVLNDGDKFKLM